MTELASLVLYAGDSTATTASCRALGLDLDREDHGEGPVHFAVELGPVHFAVYPAKVPGSPFPGFFVASLDRYVAGACPGGSTDSHRARANALGLPDSGRRPRRPCRRGQPAESLPQLMPGRPS